MRNETREFARPGATARRAGVAGGGVRRRASGPRPVRPVPVAVAVRPAEVERPSVRRSPDGVVVPFPRMRGMVAGADAAQLRVLDRGRALSVPAGGRGRRILAAVGVLVAAAVVVVGLGVLAGAVEQARGGSAEPVAAARPTLVTVTAQETVWEVARGVEPAAGGPRLAELVERIVTANSLRSLSVAPGQVLRVPAG